MNTTAKIILSAISAGLFIGYLKQKKAALEDIKINSVDVAIDIEKTKQAAFLKLYYLLKLNLQNIAPVSINVKSLEAVFFVNGIQFAESNTLMNLVIPPKSNKTLTLNANIASGQIIASLLDIIAEGSATIEVKGTLLTDLGLIEFQQKKIV